MRKLITALQMKDADLDWVNFKQRDSIELMEKAACAFVGVFCGLISDKDTSILILCGTGNNGGDGLAIARLLQASGYGRVRVLIVPAAGKESPDFLINLKRLESTPVPFKRLEASDLDSIPEEVIVDAVLGSGLNKPIGGELAAIVDAVNDANKKVIAVDSPTGFVSEGELVSSSCVLKASDVISFQRPKLNFFFPESANYLKRFHVVDIGLREEYINSMNADFYLVEAADIAKLYKKRAEFSHKGSYGHALICAGSRGMSGAALLCAEACVYTGAGLTSVCMPEEDRLALHIRIPEAMFFNRKHIGTENEMVRFSAIAIGPGLGSEADIINQVGMDRAIPLVIDADGLNYLATTGTLPIQLRKGTIITPHMKEFDRLFGASDSWWNRLQLAVQQAKELKVIIVLKNRYTFIVNADGKVFINPTGNPAMASGGMGDVLTGIIVSLLAQGYQSEDACILGCYIHGRAGDRLVSEGRAVVPASRLIKELPFVLNDIARAEADS